ncbi:prepilin-type N-terminal cleavage/methylation domain-containing protein [Motiliproteus coralliicola]|uniref:Prepilin-type N-terminal cleavage/methylation domain-containing protein n=1 Tax=Motiliproteus coralliicola TaxID=2283196 RepID=A0A369WAJ4_9GAMM|nr:prepilin-type N-terminal cleavage/methylation domain-containing protein [Motiliproteus coralliicola]RDE18311.1 prepilin-type N-terminal cleavage/methylation domain-containing protein [Motiliproteus coralliicola]
MFSKTKTAELLKKFAKVNVEDIQDADLRAKAAKLKGKQGGFTLLELLVVVAILAAIAGTAAIALQDTDARASAAAHVAMMDELNKGIRTFRVLNKNQYPNNFDALLGADVTTDGNAAGATYPSNELVAIEDIGTVALTADAVGILGDIGVTSMQYLDYGKSTDFSESGTASLECADATITTTIASRSNHVVSNNIFQGTNANGCGTAVTLAAGDQVAVWTGGYERVLGSAGVAHDTAGTPTIASAGAAITAAGANTPVLMAVGLGPSSTLFNANDLGGMTTVPSYRHVNQLQYGRFIALFEIGTFAADASYSTADQVNLVAIVDGAGDTKEEELGEWDGTRNTI